MKIKWNGHSLVFATDIEQYVGTDQRLIQFSEGCDVLIHDAQYTDEELKSHKGWGHSSYNQAIEVAERSNAKQLIITHHDPDHDDEFLEQMEKKCQQRFKNLIFARDNLEINF